MIAKRPSIWVLALGLLALTVPPGLARTAQTRRNVIVFVADAMRHGSVNEQDAPALWGVRANGVHFENSYSLFPTFTTANGSAIATGHQLGDTGDFSNVIWAGFATFDTGNFNLAPATPVPFVENDRVLADLDDHFGGNYLGEETLLGLARAAGYHTAAIGKLGPTAIQ
ncbi:MAG: alkaline phosphatase family protein, partial [Vicinamibacterales bacterium]